MVSNIALSLRLPNRPGTLANVLTVIAEKRGNLGAIDLVAATPGYIDRKLMLRLPDQEHLAKLIAALETIPDVKVTRVADRVFMRHIGGKIEIKPKRPIHDWEDLALVYTPGVATVCENIAADKDLAFKLTMKGNSVAIVTDGSAVLGLGNLGATAALPVMEGKAVLFKRFANIDAFPLCLDVHEPADIIAAVVACAPNFGGINLEDIAAPKCFEIEEKLSQLLDIPVFHDDQHGTAIACLAALINALKVVGKEMTGIKVVMSGAGAAGVAIAKILLRAGVRELIVCDSKGAIARDNLPQAPSKLWLAENTNRDCVHGSLPEVLPGADVFIGVSAPGLLHRADIRRMADNPVVFALANPEPEVQPEEIVDIAAVIATGRSDYPNQVNNALVFPGVFRGALDCRAHAITMEMCLAAAYALAGTIPDEQLSPEHIVPSVFNDQVARTVAKAVAREAERTGDCRKSLIAGEREGLLC